MMNAPVPSSLEDYVKIEKIGEGSYGVVFKGRHKKRGDIVAMKKVKIDAEEEGIPATSVREISMLRDIQHPNIVQLKDILMSDLKLYLVFEFLTMDLARFMKIHQAGLDPRMVKSYTHQILQVYNHRFCDNHFIISVLGNDVLPSKESHAQRSEACKSTSRQ